MIPIFIVLGCLVLTNSTAPVYEQGFYDGCKAGLEMGKYLGESLNVPNEGLPQICDQFNLMLQNVFGPTDNRTKELWASPTDSQTNPDQQETPSDFSSMQRSNGEPILSYSSKAVSGKGGL